MKGPDGCGVDDGGLIAAGQMRPIPRFLPPRVVESEKARDKPLDPPRGSGEKGLVAAVDLPEPPKTLHAERDEGEVVLHDRVVRGVVRDALEDLLQAVRLCTIRGVWRFGMAVNGAGPTRRVFGGFGSTLAIAVGRPGRQRGILPPCGLPVVRHRRWQVRRHHALRITQPFVGVDHFLHLMGACPGQPRLAEHAIHQIVNNRLGQGPEGGFHISPQAVGGANPRHRRLLQGLAEIEAKLDRPGVMFGRD
ncbi:unnamed protein product [Phytomonas sp. Hart1]|nr:unnamed protein product [Phytomonas sp. Hart1]|eukprot:CCW70372.1 unnamed protein product [Phytomonas sp. isolate Hart1]